MRGNGFGLRALALALGLVIGAGCGAAAPRVEATSSSDKGALDASASADPAPTVAPTTATTVPTPKREETSMRLDLTLDGKDSDATKGKGTESTKGDGKKPDKIVLDDKRPGGGAFSAGDEPSDLAQPAAATGERLSGSVDPSSVRTTLTGARDVFRRCSDSDIKLELDLTITPSGDVMDASATSSAPDDVRVRDCVVSALRRLRFQPFGGSEAARISLGLALRR